MSKVTIIDNAIEIDKKHIEEFQLESEVGTKKMRENFHKNAITKRNVYVANQQKQFDLYKKAVYKELKERFNKYFPINKEKYYDEQERLLKSYDKVIKFNNKLLDSNYKLDFLGMVSKIKEDSDNSLDDINDILNKFIDEFKNMGINLSVDDFSYSMFINKYMTNFFGMNNNIDLKSTFENVYWECPDFIKHIKLNLWFILSKYKKEIDCYKEKIRTDLLASYNLTDATVISSYYDLYNKYLLDYSRDSYINLNNFLEKKRNISDYLEESSIRNNNLNLLMVDGDFKDLSSSKCEKFYLEVLDLAKTLPVLKEYYRYEFIVKDLQEKYNKRVENKNLYNNKLKEISKEESKRKKIYSAYLRACGIGFLAKRDDKKISALKLEMNEQILKLFSLYSELHDLEIVDKIGNQLSEISSLYDLFMTGYSSFYYLERMFCEKFNEDDSFDLNKELDRYFRFIYNPSNSFLAKINAFVSYDIAEIISDKYRLLELNVPKDNIMKDSIDSMIDTVNFVKLIKDISSSDLSLNNMNFIVNFKEFDEVIIDDVVDIECI